MGVSAVAQPGDDRTKVEEARGRALHDAHPARCSGSLRRTEEDEPLSLELLEVDSLEESINDGGGLQKRWRAALSREK